MMMMMELAAEVVNTWQYALPVGLVILCAALVFAFGFKKVEEPRFTHLSGGGLAPGPPLGSSSSLDQDGKLSAGPRTKRKAKDTSKPERQKSPVKNQSSPAPAQKQSPKAGSPKAGSPKATTAKAGTPKAGSPKAGEKEKPQRQDNKKAQDNAAAASPKQRKEAKKEVKPKKQASKAPAPQEPEPAEPKPEGFDDADWVEAGARSKEKKSKKKDSPDDMKAAPEIEKQDEAEPEVKVIAKVKEETVPEKAKVPKEKKEKKKKEKKEEPPKEEKKKELIGMVAPASPQPKEQRKEKKDNKKKIAPEKHIPVEVPKPLPVEPKNNKNGDSSGGEAIEILTASSASLDSSSKGTDASLESFEIISSKENIAFDELGDTWVEPKPKKKKARKEV